MAKKAKYDWGRSSNSRYQKFETKLSFKVDTSDGSSDSKDSAYIDIAQCLSLTNRKLVRQGHVFKVKNMLMWTNDSDGDGIMTSVATLPRTWMMFNAYKKARSLWNQMNLEAIDALGSGNLPKYYDFKTFFDVEHFDNHHNNDGGDVTVNLLPVDSGGTAFAGTGEWVYSKYETSAATPLEMNIHMLGTHATASGVSTGSSGRDLPNDEGSIGAILAYQQSRGAAFTDQDLAGLDQNVDIDSPWAQLFAGDTQMQQVLTDLDVDNDAPPYPADYAGAVEHPEGVLVAAPQWLGGGNSTHVSGGTGRGRFGTFEAPLGLVKIDFNHEGDDVDVDGVYITFDTEIIGSC